MKKMLFPVYVALAVLGCGSDHGDLPDCLNCIITVYGKCGEWAYDKSTEGCCNNKEVYSKETYVCSNNTVYPKCSEKGYKPATEFCSENTVYTKCGEKDYKPATEFCLGNSIYPKCGGSSYIPSTQYCSNGTVKTYSGSVSYGGQTYKTQVIGTQTWFAENLNYDVEGSRLITYGRLYDWSTAMALPSNCNSNYCSSQIQTKHRGICPSGWHISSMDEWNTLSNYVQSNSGCSNCDARLLKATSGWYTNGNGTNQYGFSALPGGDSYSGGSFFSVGDFGYWWSANENDNRSALYRGMHSNDDDVYSRGGQGKIYLLSVRCVQD